MGRQQAKVAVEADDPDEALAAVAAVVGGAGVAGSQRGAKRQREPSLRITTAGALAVADPVASGDGGAGGSGTGKQQQKRQKQQQKKKQQQKEEEVEVVEVDDGEEQPQPQPRKRQRKGDAAEQAALARALAASVKDAGAGAAAAAASPAGTSAPGTRRKAVPRSRSAGVAVSTAQPEVGRHWVEVYCCSDGDDGASPGRHVGVSRVHCSIALWIHTCSELMVKLFVCVSVCAGGWPQTR